VKTLPVIQQPGHQWFMSDAARCTV